MGRKKRRKIDTWQAWVQKTHIDAFGHEKRAWKEGDLQVGAYRRAMSCPESRAELFELARWLQDARKEGRRRPRDNTLKKERERDASAAEKSGTWRKHAHGYVSLNPTRTTLASETPRLLGAG